MDLTSLVVASNSSVADIVVVIIIDLDAIMDWDVVVDPNKFCEVNNAGSTVIDVNNMFFKLTTMVYQQNKYLGKAELVLASPKDNLPMDQ